MKFLGINTYIPYLEAYSFAKQKPNNVYFVLKFNLGLY